MSAIWHDSGTPSFFAPKPVFSFHELAEVHEVAPAIYAAARFSLQQREFRLGAAWYRRNAFEAWQAWQRNRPWWLL